MDNKTYTILNDFINEEKNNVKYLIAYINLVKIAKDVLTKFTNLDE